MKYFLSFALLTLFSCGNPSINNDLIVSETIAYEELLWSNGKELNVLFLNGDKELQDKVIDYSSEWTRYANIKFKYYSLKSERLFLPPKFRRDTIRIRFEKGKGGESPVGLSFNSSYFNLNEMILRTSGDYFSFKSTVIHEFGHALGLAHEHQHPEVLRTLSEQSIKTKCLFSGADDKTCHENIRRPITHKVRLFSYDSQSIMHYSLSGTSAGEVELGDFSSNFYLSLNDKISISKLYPFEVPLLEEEIRSMHISDIEKERSIIRKMALSKNCKIVSPSYEGICYGKGYTLLDRSGDYVDELCLPSFEIALKNLEFYEFCYE